MSIWVFWVTKFTPNGILNSISDSDIIFEFCHLKKPYWDRIEKNSAFGGKGTKEGRIQKISIILYAELSIKIYKLKI